jgi:hypothetical protein
MKKTNFFGAIMVMMALPLEAYAKPSKNISDPIFLCNTERDETEAGVVKAAAVDFYIETPDSNINMTDGNLFFGGAKVYFFSGDVIDVNFLLFGNDEKHQTGKSGINLFDNYITTASNISADSASATFDISLVPNGFASKRYSNWSGHCVQVAEANEPILRQLKIDAASKSK